MLSRPLKALNFIFLLFIPFLISAQDSRGLDERINDAFTPVAAWWEHLVFYPFPFSDLILPGGIPIVVILLILGALFFTLVFKFPNITKFGTAIRVVRGTYDDLEGHGAPDKAAVNMPDGDIVDTIRDEGKDGEVTHFQALTTAVSGTVGLGNIAGVAIAISIGGPGATFWMILCGLLGMSTKFVECTLGLSIEISDQMVLSMEDRCTIYQKV